MESKTESRAGPVRGPAGVLVGHNVACTRLAEAIDVERTVITGESLNVQRHDPLIYPATTEHWLYATQI